MALQTSIQKNISPLRTTFVVLLVISLLYPLFFAYIDKSFSLHTLAVELLFTPARLAGIAFICYGFIRLMHMLQHHASFKFPPLLRHLAAACLVLFCAYWFLVAFIVLIDGPLTGSKLADPASWEFRRHIGLYLLGTLFIYTFLSGLDFYHEAQMKNVQAQKLQKEYAQVRLQALRSQVNPHFLFNSLSVLSSLVHVDAALSEKFIVQLSKAYRYILDQKEHDLVSLKEELAFLESYFFLLQIRFDKKVQLLLDVPTETNTYRIPPLTLQLLVENAVKHNSMSLAAPLVISVRVQGLQLLVANNISGREQEATSTGIGLENIKNRYALLCDQKVAVVQDEQHFSVSIPLIKPA